MLLLFGEADNQMLPNMFPPSLPYKVFSCCGIFCAVFGSKALEELREQEERLAEELERGRIRMQELNEELVKVLGELQSARIDSQENRRQQRRDEVLESLCRLYPDVVVL